MASHLFETLDDPLGTIEDLFVSLIIITVNLIWCASVQLPVKLLYLLLEHNTSVHYFAGYC